MKGTEQVNGIQGKLNNFQYGALMDVGHMKRTEQVSLAATLYISMLEVEVPSSNFGRGI
jgi:hypothetical protein